MIKVYNSTDISALLTKGIYSTQANDLDCNCVDDDCSIETYEY